MSRCVCLCWVEKLIIHSDIAVSDEDQKKKNFRKVTERLHVCLCLRVRTKRSFATNQYCFLRWTEWEMTVCPWLWLTWFIKALNFHIQQFNKELKCQTVNSHWVQDRQIQTSQLQFYNVMLENTPYMFFFFHFSIKMLLNVLTFNFAV